MRQLFIKTINEIEKRNEEARLNLYGSELQTSEQMILFLKEKIEVLKQNVLYSKFKSIKEEIFFFREVKPKVQGLLIYYKYIYNVELSCPIGFCEEIKTYYTTRMKEFSKSNREKYTFNSFYQYIKSGKSNKDELFFTRGRNNDVIYKNNESFMFIDVNFTTLYDCLFSLIIAEENFCTYVKEKIKRSEVIKMEFDSLNWSAPKSSLVELIYALYASNSINNTSIRKIAMRFEILFGIKLGDIHHTYHRMKYRSNSRTLFLDRLKISLEHQLQVSDA